MSFILLKHTETIKREFIVSSPNLPDCLHLYPSANIFSLQWMHCPCSYLRSNPSLQHWVLSSLSCWRTYNSSYTNGCLPLSRLLPLAYKYSPTSALNKTEKHKQTPRLPCFFCGSSISLLLIATVLEVVALLRFLPSHPLIKLSLLFVHQNHCMQSQE